MKLIIAASLGALALGVLGAAQAQDANEVVVTGHKAANPGSEVKTTTVNYADLDLSKTTGLSALLRRIRTAATGVCSPLPENKNLADSTDYNRCVSDAVSTAVTKVDNPGLKAMIAKR